MAHSKHNRTSSSNNANVLGYSSSDSPGSSISADAEESSNDMLERVAAITETITEVVSLVFPDPHARGLVTFDIQPAPKLRDLYVRVLLPKNKIARHRRAGTEPQWKTIAIDLARRRLPRAGDFLTSLVWHFIHSEIIEAELPMNKFRSTVDITKTPGRFLYAALHDRGEDPTAVFHEAAVIQWSDSKFLEDVVEPVAHEYALDLMVTLSGHFFEIDSTKSAADWHPEAVHLLRKACREAVVMNGKSKALGEHLEFLFPTGEEFDSDEMTAGPGYKGDLVAHTIAPRVHAGEHWVIHPVVALVETAETMDEGSD
jgi:hypothetical protein